MSWKPTPVRVVPSTTRDSKTKFTHVRPEGTLKKIFTMKVDEGFSEKVRGLCESLKGEWSMASVLRLALDRLDQEMRGEPRVEIGLLLEEPDTSSGGSTSPNSETESTADAS